MKPVPGTPYFVPDCEEHYLSRAKRGTGPRFFDKYQHDIIDAALPFVRCFKTAIDCGANVGLLSHKMAEHFEHVVAFEPAEDSYECLIKNTEHLSNVSCLNYAVGDEHGFVGMRDDTSESDKSSGRRQVDRSRSEVEMVTIDSQNISDVGLIKLDIQGYELFALQGAYNTLMEWKPVCVVEVESVGRLDDSYGTKPTDAVEFLESLGAKVRTKVRHDWIISW